MKKRLLGFTPTPESRKRNLRDEWLKHPERLSPHYNSRESLVWGFTILELIIVFSIVAIIGASILYFLNPAQQFSQARNNSRISDVNSIASAIRLRMTENRGNFATGCASGNLPTSTKQMGSGALNYNVEPCIVPTYISVMPLDPQTGTSTATGYFILHNVSTTQVTITAPGAELGQMISVTR